MHLSLIVELPAKTERNIKMIVKIYLTFWLGAFENIYKRWIEKGRGIQRKTSQTHFLQLKHFCTVHSVQTERKKKLYTSCHQTKSKGSNNRRQTGRSLLLLAFGFPVHHLPEARQDLALSLSPLLLVERCQGSLFVCAVDLVFLSQTHSLHTTMSAGQKFVSITGRKAEHAPGSAQLNPA